MGGKKEENIRKEIVVSFICLNKMNDGEKKYVQFPTQGRKLQKLAKAVIFFKIFVLLQEKKLFIKLQQDKNLFECIFFFLFSSWKNKKKQKNTWMLHCLHDAWSTIRGETKYINPILIRPRRSYQMSFFTMLKSCLLFHEVYTFMKKAIKNTMHSAIL